MYKFPIEFEFSATANDNYKNAWSCISHEYEGVACDIPRKFNGMGQGFSPEELFGMSLLNCFIATYKFYAMQAEMTFDSLKVNASLLVDRAENGKPCMKIFSAVIKLQNVSDVGLAQDLFLETEKNCFIINSVKTECDFSLVIS